MIRVDAGRLRTGIADLLAGAGMDPDKAEVVAEMLVEADLIGHSTHGTGLVEGYLDALASGELNGRGGYEVLADRGACITWRGNRLPGAWLVHEALELACARAPQYGVVTPSPSAAAITPALSPPTCARSRSAASSRSSAARRPPLPAWRRSAAPRRS